MRFSIFDFLGKRVDDAEIEAIGDKIAQVVSFRELALHIAISYIANTLSKCEIKVYREGEEVQDELYYMLNYNPNPNQNSSQFMNDLIERYFYDGSALVVQPRPGTVYCSDGYSLFEKPLKENIFDNVSIEGEKISREFKASDVFFFKLDNREVINLVRMMYNEYGLVLSAALQRFKSANKDQWKLILDNYQAGDKAFNKIFNETIKDQLKVFLESDRAVYPQFKGMDLQPINQASYSSDDIISIRKEIFETTAQAFKIPMSMMLGNITNMNEIVKVYLSICVDPIAQMISEEFTRKQFSFDEWKKGSKILVDTSCINHVDMLDVADKADKLIASGTANRDEVRKRLGLDVLNTESSQAYYITKNYEPADNALNPAEGGETIETE